ncbi:magnesium/cobalt transporter CorA [Oceanibacterium hippocampi]|uniref:Magnesium transport protein CorA n=1 Tax=Oceanibacterium hippocampi TaxID=745714 RepID=A0A1Y5U388_9PROT|nr:magnesium/cobalt transporter CorA [Oceanibacterium hippocampi]SLN75764.1 Magnesium transport protein CorA [Oceanibacterium hippocampi]
MSSRRNGLRSRRRAPPGSSPGVLIADPQAVRSQVSLFGYGDDRLIERDNVSLADIEALKGTVPNLWVNVDGLADIALIKALGELFGLHDLALEDVVNLHQRPKADQYEDHIFVATRMVAAEPRPRTEQVSIFIGADFVLTFQERPGDCLDPVRARIRQHRGRIRQSGSDYLAYALIDAVIDAFFPVLEDFGERLEMMEDEVVTRPEPGMIERLHDMKRDLLNLRRAIWPHREMLNTLIRDETPLITDQTRIYLRDCYDHTVQLMDIVETYREIASGLVDVYLSSMSTRLNDIMKVLTIIATIFIPLGFIASLYGMNFDRTVSLWNMPELGWRYGYPASLLLMLATAGGLLYYFRRRGWLGSRRKRTREPKTGHDTKSQG